MVIIYSHKWKKKKFYLKCNLHAKRGQSVFQITLSWRLATNQRFDSKFSPPR